MSETMKALVKAKEEPGIWLGEVPVPEVGPNDVLIKVKQAAICGTDLHMIRGTLAGVAPGTILGHANRVLAPYGTKLGPDPASTDVATVGGVIANNSGGMRCGVVADSYSTVRSMTLVLPAGTVGDTGAQGAAERFAREEPELTRGLARIRDEIRADAELSARIRRKFEIKNTTGYRLCAFLDADEPVEIFRRLVVGSEGTLAFIAEAVMETVPQPPRCSVRSHSRCCSRIVANSSEKFSSPPVRLPASATSRL